MKTPIFFQDIFYKSGELYHTSSLKLAEFRTCMMFTIKSMDRPRIILLSASILTIIFSFIFGFHVVAELFSFLYPANYTMSLEEPTIQILSYWMLFSAINVVQHFFETFLTLGIHFYLLKFSLLGLAFAPQIHGGEFIYYFFSDKISRLKAHLKFIQIFDHEDDSIPMIIQEQSPDYEEDSTYLSDYQEKIENLQEKLQLLETDHERGIDAELPSTPTPTPIDSTPTTPTIEG